MAWEIDATSPVYPASGPTPETAPKIEPGFTSGSEPYTGTDDSDTYRTFNQISDTHKGNVGWYKFTASTSGMVSIGSNHGLISMYEASSMTLVGARYNGGFCLMYCDVERGKTYYLRFSSGFQSNLYMQLSKIAMVAHSFGAFSPISLTTNGTSGSLSGNTATLDWGYEFLSSHPRYAYAKDLIINMSPVPIPTIVQDQSTANIADIRVILHARSTTDPALASGPAFEHYDTNGSFRWTWLHDWSWDATNFRNRWISIRASNGAFMVRPDEVIAGTLKGFEGPNFENLGLGRNLGHNGPPSDAERAIVDVSQSGIRMSWFVPMPDTVIYPGELNTRQKFFEGSD